MSKLTLRWNNVTKCIELHFKDKELQNFLSCSIQQNSRTWSKVDKCWAIVPEVLPKVIAYSRHIFDHVDASSIPISYQKSVQKALQGIIEEPSTSHENTYTPRNQRSSPYSLLYIMESAPEFVIKAAYKALAFKYHPDRGGDAEQFQIVTAAYNSIMEGRKK